MIKTVLKCFVILFCLLAMFVGVISLAVYWQFAHQKWVSARIETLVVEANSDPTNRQPVEELFQIAKQSSRPANIRAVHALVQVNVVTESDLARIVSLLDSPDPFMKRNAALALERMGDRVVPVLPILAARVAREDLQWDANRFAIGAIANCGADSEEYLPMLRSKLEKVEDYSKGPLESAIRDIERAIDSNQ